MHNLNINTCYEHIIAYYFMYAISETEAIFRVYVGNLTPNCPEETLRSLFTEYGVEVGHILVKRSYAFVDCEDQTNVDKAIEKLNGKQYYGVAVFIEFTLHHATPQC